MAKKEMSVRIGGHQRIEIDLNGFQAEPDAPAHDAWKGYANRECRAGGTLADGFLGPAAERRRAVRQAGQHVGESSVHEACGENGFADAVFDDGHEGIVGKAEELSRRRVATIGPGSSGSRKEEAQQIVRCASGRISGPGVAKEARQQTGDVLGSLGKVEAVSIDADGRAGSADAGVAAREEAVGEHEQGAIADEVDVSGREAKVEDGSGDEGRKRFRLRRWSAALCLNAGEAGAYAAHESADGRLGKAEVLVYLKLRQPILFLS